MEIQSQDILRNTWDFLIPVIFFKSFSPFAIITKINNMFLLMVFEVPDAIRIKLVDLISTIKRGLKFLGFYAIDLENMSTNSRHG